MLYSAKSASQFMAGTISKISFAVFASEFHPCHSIRSTLRAQRYFTVRRESMQISARMKIFSTFTAVRVLSDLQWLRMQRASSVLRLSPRLLKTQRKMPKSTASPMRDLSATMHQVRLRLSMMRASDPMLLSSTHRERVAAEMSSKQLRI